MSLATLPPRAAPVPPVPARRSGQGFRADIQGMRAVAVLLVVLYHAGVPALGGGYVGVDVFFVISGFLITGHLVGEVETTGRVRLGRFYLNRVRRLLPTAAVVLVVTLIVARLWGSILRVPATAHDALAAGFSLMNVRLAGQGVDYAHAGDTASPVQHFWSLSVEEQYYLVWPVLIIAVTWLARRRLRTALAAVLVVVAVGSLATSQHLLVTNTPLAYFSLQSRAWELAVGGGVALLAGLLGRLPRSLAAGATWAGLLAVVACAFVYDDRTLFPGTAALWPVLASAAVIAGGCARPERGAQAFLRHRALQGIGKISYAWYLWHWPVLILAPAVLGRPLSLVESLEMVLVSLWISVVSYWCIEAQTMRGVLRLRSWTLGGACMVLVVGLSAQLALVSAPPVVGAGDARPVVLAAGSDSYAVKVAVSRSLSETTTPGNLAPPLSSAQDDEPATSNNGCHAEVLAVDQPDCVFGDPTGARTMVLFGDSHAQQWFPALEAQARMLGWRLVSWTKSGCPIAAQDVYSQQLGREYTECSRWREATVRRIVLLDPDVVVVSQSDTVTLGQSARAWTDNTASTLGRFQEAGVPAVYLLDTPSPSQDVPACVASHLRNTGACVISRDRASPKGRHEAMEAALRSRSITTLDPYDMFCGIDACPPIVGNVLVYRDESHMSASYAEFLAPATGALFVPRG